MDIEKLVERISFIRTRANLSACRLSKMIGMSDGYIHMLEHRKNFAPKFETFMAILNACNTTLEEFFYYDIKAYKQDSQIIELLKKVKDDDKKRAILTLLNS